MSVLRAVFVLLALACVSQAAISRVSESIIVDALGLAGAQTQETLMATSVAQQAVALAQRAGLTTQAAVQADQALELGDRGIGDVIKAAVNNVKAAVQNIFKPTFPASGKPSEEQATMFFLSRAIYNRDYLKAGDTSQISYKQQCIDVKVLAAVTKNGFLAWALHVPAWNVVIAVFRGTKSAQNVVTDLDMVTTECNFDGRSCGKVHKGFFTDYSLVRSTINSAIRAFLTANKGITTVYTTGHSLGAAISELAAFDIANWMSKSFPSVTEVRSVNFGCPRPGDSGFASAFSAGFKGLTLASTRFAHWRSTKILAATLVEYDPVAIVAPASFGYSHVGTEFALECQTCDSWVSLHVCRNYQATFTRLLGHDGNAQCTPEK
jgi:hypothetical protein